MLSFLVCETGDDPRATTHAQSTASSFIEVIDFEEREVGISLPLSKGGREEVAVLDFKEGLFAYFRGRGRGF